MEQLISKPLKRFLFESKELSKRRKNSRVQYCASLDAATINMTEIKSIMKPHNKIEETNIDSVIKNNVLFNDDIETISHNISEISEDNFAENILKTQLVKVKIIKEPVKELPTILDLKNSDDSIGSVHVHEKLNNSVNSDGFIDIEQPSVVRVKVKIINKNKAEKDKTENDIVNDPLDSITPAKSIEEFQNYPLGENRHKVDETCIFDENKNRPLSPIPVIPRPISPKTQFNNLIDFHEKQSLKLTGRSPPRTLPRMGTSALFNRSPSTLNDSEIISALVRDRFVVNMYESRSFKRQIKKPSQYGRIYKSLEKNYKNDYFTKQNLLNNDIVTIKQSSPIKIKDVQVSSKTFILEDQNILKNKINNTNSSSTLDEISDDIKNATIPEEPLSEAENMSEIICKEVFQKSPSSEYGSGSNSVQSCSTISLEHKLEENQENYTFASEVSSYNMEDFLKKALGDELNNMDNTEITFKSESIPTLQQKCEESISTSNASDLISKINTFQSNIYRSFTKKLQNMTDTLRLPHGQTNKPQDKLSTRSDIDSLFSNNEEVNALLKQAAVQYEALKQISKALTLCRNSKEFCVSSEQVEGERLLLIATYKRQAILDEIRRLEYTPLLTNPSSETGSVTISNITIPVKPSSPEQPRGRDLSKWYVVVLSSGLQVSATQPTAVAGDGSVKFKEEVVFEDLPSQFEVNVEVYCLLQRKQVRNFSHESKYHINKDTKRSHCPTPKKFLSREKPPKNITQHDTGIRVSSFKLCGSLKLTVNDLAKSGPWDLRGKIPLCSSLSGTIYLTLLSQVQIPVKQCGFLTVGGLASWNRRWCVLHGNEIRFWNYPTEEESQALKVIDLKYCVSSKVTTADRSICARPRTLLLEIARRKRPEDSESMMMNCRGSYTIEKHYLSADNIEELNNWQRELDKVVQALRIWNVGFLSCGFDL